MWLKGLSNVTDEYFAVMINDRDYYDAVADAIDAGFGYDSVMKLMKNLRDKCMRARLVANPHTPNRTQLYLHMAASMDKLLKVHPEILDYSQRNGYLQLQDEEQPVKQPKEVTTVEFSTVHYINDKDVKDHTDDELIGLIKREQDNITALEVLGIASTNINNKIATHKDNVERLVHILDSRTSK